MKELIRKLLLVSLIGLFGAVFVSLKSNAENRENRITVEVILNNERLLDEVAENLAQYLEPSKAAFWAAFSDTTLLRKLGYDGDDLMTLFIPNTYELYWNGSAKDFLLKMRRENDRFWKKNFRDSKVRKLRLSKKEIYILASIIEKETRQNDEKPRMAGVYYNRLKSNMLLQADPTAVFARRDFNTRRVTHYHTKYDSPYNTYKYKGLPPGPICMPSIASIDAVLNLEAHDYLFFCARGDGSGYHNFARTLEAHNANAKIYKQNKFGKH